MQNLHRVAYSRVIRSREALFDHRAILPLGRVIRVASENWLFTLLHLIQYK